MIGRALLVLALLSLAPLTAFANPDLDKAIHLSGELEFNSALRSFQKALDSGTLSKGELATLLAERALLLHALRRQPEVVSDFRWLAAVDPAYKLDQRAPPDLTATWDSVRRETGAAAASVELRDESGPGVLRLRPFVKGAQPEGLHIDAYFRAGSAAFEPLDQTSGVERSYPEGAYVQAYATLYGPGRVVLSSAGSPQNPLAFNVAAASAGAEAPLPVASRDERMRIDKKWFWIGGAAAVVIGVVIVAAVVAGGGEDSKDVKLTPIWPD
jgi:hypothetical protein